MDAATLKKVFGDKANQAQGILFQHGTRITQQAEFMDPDRCLKLRKNERAAKQKYRKSQVHPTVWAEAMSSAHRSSDLPIMNNEVAVIMTGGTPEAIVGAMAAGYRTILYIASDANEAQMMMLPTEVEEQTDAVDYNEYLCFVAMVLLSIQKRWVFVAVYGCPP